MKPKIFAFIACAAFLLLVGCVAIEGRASSTMFSVRADNGRKEPSTSTVLHDVDAWAHRHGFTKVSNPPGERYASVSYTLTLEHPKRTFSLGAGYVPGPNFNQVIGGISAPYRKEDQDFIDAMFTELRKEVHYEVRRL